MGDRERFGQSYWTQDSQYQKFEDYSAALAAIRNWYQGFFRLVAPDLPPPGRALDAGCGHGAIVYELADRGFDAYGVDVSPWIIEQAQMTSDPRLTDRFAVGDLAEIPFEGSFDLITCLEVLEHLPKPVDALRAMRARLRPNGRLIATTPNLKPTIPWLWDAEAVDPTHISVHEPSWWRHALENADFAVRRVSTFVSVPVFWRLHPMFARWIPLGRRSGPGVLMIADVRVV